MSEWFVQMLEEKVLDFSEVLNTSITAGWMTLVVIVLRLLLKKAPKWTHAALWGLVALRLLLPFSSESEFSLIPSAQTVPEEILEYQGTQLLEPARLDVISNPVITGNFSVELEQTADRMQIRMMFLTYPWLVGITVLVLYAVISCLRLKRKLETAVRYRDNIFRSENVGSPFVFGVIKPRIYLPYKLDARNLEYVIAHEQAHIRRLDHLWKPLGFLLLTVHWFNPLLWAAYILLCRDIELACDERVVKEYDEIQRADYSEALLGCSVKQKAISACPLSFGEVGVKTRIRSVLNYRKPTFWIVGLAVTAGVVTAVCFLTDPEPMIDPENISSVTVKSQTVSAEEAEQLIDMLNGSRSTFYMTVLEEPDSPLSATVKFHCRDGSMYVLQYQYYSGFSFNPAHFGDDDYRSILTCYSQDGSKSRERRLEYDFDAQFKAWYDEVIGDRLLNLSPVVGSAEGQLIFENTVIDSDIPQQICEYRYVPVCVTDTMRESLFEAYFGDRADEVFCKDEQKDIWQLGETMSGDFYRYGTVSGGHIFTLRYSVPNLNPLDDNQKGYGDASGCNITAEEAVRLCDELLASMTDPAQYRVDYIHYYGSNGQSPFYWICYKKILEGRTVNAYKDVFFFVDDNGVEEMNGAFYDTEVTAEYSEVLSAEQAVEALRKQLDEVNWKEIGISEVSRISLEYITVREASGWGTWGNDLSNLTILPIWRMELGKTEEERILNRNRIIGVHAVTGELIQNLTGMGNYN